MQLVDFSLSNCFELDGSDIWQSNTIKRDSSIFDPTNKYTYWFIPKFTPVTKIFKLTSELLSKMIIVDRITEQEIKVFIKMLYNKEALLAWDFIKR